jgi:hypothetical protein
MAEFLSARVEKTLDSLQIIPSKWPLPTVDNPLAELSP